MSVRNITEEQYHDRIEWLSGAAGQDLANANQVWLVGMGTEVIDVLDRIKQAAEQCAKCLREGPKMSVPSERVRA